VNNLVVQIIDNCGTDDISYFYLVSGATSRIGWSADASGMFNVGYNLVNFTVTDAHGNVSMCSFNIYVYKHTTANAGPDINTCIGVPVYVVGNIPTHGTTLWEQVGGPTTATIAQPENYSTYISNLAAGTYAFRYTIAHGPCSSTDEMQIIIGTGPSQANAGPDQMYCGGTTSAVMAATPPTSGLGMWSQMSGPTTVSISNLFNPAATIGNLGTGIYVMKWAVSSGSCNPSIDYMNITVKPAMTVNAGPDVLLAASASGYYLSSSSASNYNSLAWTRSGTGFFNNATILHPTYYPSAADKTLGFVDLTLTGFQTGCQQKSDVMRITFKKDLELDPEASSFTVTVMPNPFFDEANIEFTLPEAGFLTMKVVDMNGRIVGMPADKFEVSGTSLTRQIKAAGMAPGIYSWYAVLDGTEKQHFQSGRLVIAR
jgi:hypothetical protein